MGRRASWGVRRTDGVASPVMLVAVTARKVGFMLIRGVLFSTSLQNLARYPSGPGISWPSAALNLHRESGQQCDRESKMTPPLKDECVYKFRDGVSQD